MRKFEWTYMFILIKNIFLLLTIISVSSCTTTRTHTYSSLDRENICNENSTNLGNTVVLLETAWRSDQKEPIKRSQMALEEIRNVFETLPCGKLSLKDGISVNKLSNIPDIEMLEIFSNDGIDTVIIIRIEELTPRLDITFSIPFLWSGYNEADFHIRAISIKTGKTFIDMRVKRITGGPFNIRPDGWSGAELNSALHSIIQ